MTPGDIARELRATRPAAPDALRNRVRTIVTTEPPARPTFGARLAALRPRSRRSFVVLVPVAAMSVALAAGVVQLVRPDDRASVAVATSPTDRSGNRVEGDAAPPAATEAYDGRTNEAAGAGADAAGSAMKMAAPATGSTLPAPTSDRAQRTSVTLALEVPGTDELSAATQKAIATTRTLGGYLVTVQVGTSTTGASSIVAKVPTARVQEAIARLSALGTITSQNVQIDDLQASLDDVVRRTAVLRKRIAAITGRLDSASLTSEERAALEATRQALRDELAGSRRTGQAIRDEAALATIALEIRTAPEEEVVPAAPTRFDRALDDMQRILAIEGIVLLYGLVVLVPLGLAAGLLAFGARALGRRSRDRLFEAS